MKKIGEDKKRFAEAEKKLQKTEKKIARFAGEKHEFQEHSTAGEWCDSNAYFCT